jgi:hypothetical protein
VTEALSFQLAYTFHLQGMKNIDTTALSQALTTACEKKVYNARVAALKKVRKIPAKRQQAAPKSRGRVASNTLSLEGEDEDEAPGSGDEEEEEEQDE